MDSVLTSSNEELIDNLNLFQLPTQASYILEQRKALYAPQSGNVYTSGSGSKLIRFNLTSGGGWLDPESVFFNFDIRNADSTLPLGLLSEPYAFFSRMRLMSKGKVVQDIQDYNRVHYTLSQIYKTQNEIVNENAMGGRGLVDTTSFRNLLNSAGTLTDMATTGAPKLLKGNIKKMCFHPMLGLFNQKKFIPLSFTDLVLEIEIVAKATDSVIETTVATQGIVPTDFTATWEIINPTITANIALLDSGAENNYSGLLLSGKSLNIPFTSHVSSLQTVTDKTFQINVSRNLTKLKKIFCSYDKNLPTAAAASRNLYLNKPYRALYAPRTEELKFVGKPESEPDKDVITKLQVQIGSHLFPETPVDSIAEAYKYTKECNPNKALAIDSFDFHNEKFVFGLNLEKAKGGKFDGLNVKNNQIIVYSSTKSTPNRMHVILEHDSILEINDTSVNVYD